MRGPLPDSVSRQTFVAIRYNHVRSDARPSKRSRLRHARTIVSCTASLGIRGGAQHPVAVPGEGGAVGFQFGDIDHCGVIPPRMETGQRAALPRVKDRIDNCAFLFYLYCAAAVSDLCCLLFLYLHEYMNNGSNLEVLPWNAGVMQVCPFC